MIQSDPAPLSSSFPCIVRFRSADIGDPKTLHLLARTDHQGQQYITEFTGNHIPGIAQVENIQSWGGGGGSVSLWELSLEPGVIAFEFPQDARNKRWLNATRWQDIAREVRLRSVPAMTHDGRRPQSPIGGIPLTDEAIERFMRGRFRAASRIIDINEGMKSRRGTTASVASPISPEQAMERAGWVITQLADSIARITQQADAMIERLREARSLFEDLQQQAGPDRDHVAS